MMAGATPSARAAALKLPRVATDTKDSKTLSLSMFKGLPVCGSTRLVGMAQFLNFF